MNMHRSRELSVRLGEVRLVSTTPRGKGNHAACYATKRSSWAPTPQYFSLKRHHFESELRALTATMVSTTAHALCCLAVAAAYTLPSTKINAPRWRRTTARRAVDLSPFEEEVIRSADDQYPLTLDNVEICVEINQCVGCTRQFFTKSFLGDDAAVLARSMA